MAATLSPLALLVLGAATAASAANSTACNADTFASLTLGNINILSLDIRPIRNQSLTEGSSGSTGVGIGIISASTGEAVSAVDLCKISIRYTHPGQNDDVNTWVGLPLDPAGWNSRFMMTGGGG